MLISLATKSATILINEVCDRNVLSGFRAHPTSPNQSRTKSARSGVKSPTTVVVVLLWQACWAPGKVHSCVVGLPCSHPWTKGSNCRWSSSLTVKPWSLNYVAGSLRIWGNSLILPWSGCQRDATRRPNGRIARLSTIMSWYGQLAVAATCRPVGSSARMYAVKVGRPMRHNPILTVPTRHHDMSDEDTWQPGSFTLLIDI